MRPNKVTARERKLMMGGEVGFGLRVGVRWLGWVAAGFSRRWIILDNLHRTIEVEMKSGVPGCGRRCDAV